MGFRSGAKRWVATRVMHNYLLNAGVGSCGRSFRLKILLLSLIGLTTMLSSFLAQAQEPSPNALQASGDSGNIALADEAAESSPDFVDGAPAAAEISPQRIIVTTGQGTRALLQQQPQATIWLAVDGADGGQRSVLGLFFTPLTEAETVAVVVLADEGHNAGQGFLAALAQGLADRGLAALTLGLPPPPGRLGQLMEQPLPLPKAPAAEDDASQAPLAEAVQAGEAGSNAASDAMLMGVLPGARLSEAELQYRLGVAAELRAAIGYLKRENYQHVVIVGVGRGANFVTALPELADSDGLVWLLPRFYPRDRQALVKRFAKATKLPVLDLQAARGNSTQTARQRAALMNQVKVAQYQRQRVAVQEPAQVRHGDALASRIASWIQAAIN